MQPVCLRPPPPRDMRAVARVAALLAAVSAATVIPAAPAVAVAPVTIESPANGSAIADTTPAYRGVAGDAPDDAGIVTVRVYGGAIPEGAPVGTLQTTRTGAAWSVDGVAPLADGGYTAVAEQALAGGEVATSAPVSFTVDTLGPQTHLLDGPGGPTRDTTPEFAFASPDAERFACRLQRANQAAPSFTDCTSPWTAAPLADGAYAFEVAAIDAAGNQDASPRRTAFIVDTVAPVTTLSVGPADTTAADAAFAFTANEPATFECSLDGGAWQRCTPNQVYPGLAMGPHSFQVQATDRAGNTETGAATHSWDVLQPGLRIPAAGAQAAMLARELVQLRGQLKHTSLKRLTRRGRVRFDGFDAVTAGRVDLRLSARRGSFASGAWILDEPGRYRLFAGLTRRGKRLARRRDSLRVSLTVVFTDRVGRALRATAATTVKR